jgi:hypothetical protein
MTFQEWWTDQEFNPMIYGAMEAAWNAGKRAQREIDALQTAGDTIAVGRTIEGKPPFNAVVVEQDWPEFDAVWSMIEARVSGKPWPSELLGGWLPIETAPKNNKVPLLLARFNDDGTMQSFDYDGIWESDQESWEIPEVYWYWASANGNVEEPSHWMYQPEWFDKVSPYKGDDDGKTD